MGYEPEQYEDMKYGVSQKFNYLNYFVTMATEAQHYQDSTLYAWIGQKRSGKSVTSLAATSKIDPTFNEDQIVFDVEDFKELVKDPDTTRCGIMWDEAGVTAYSRDFQKEANKTLNKLMQVYGFKEVAISCTFPHLNFLDKQTREVLDMIFRCFYKRTKEEGNRKHQVYVAPYKLLTDWIREPSIVEYKTNIDGVFKPVGAIPVPQIDELFKWGGVSKKLYNQYLQKKHDFFETVGEDTEAEATKKEGNYKKFGKAELLIPAITRIRNKHPDITIDEACELVGISKPYYYDAIRDQDKQTNLKV